MDQTELYKASVDQIVVGFYDAVMQSPPIYKAFGSVSLITDKCTADVRILVDTGCPSQKDLLLTALNARGIEDPEMITHVICTHGHVDHLGNLNLFPRAEMLMDGDIAKNGLYSSITFDSSGSYRLSPNVLVHKLAGHTSCDLIAAVATDAGTVVVAGDLFENEADLSDDSIWQRNSFAPEKQKEARRLILDKADFIIPGHGKMFRVVK